MTAGTYEIKNKLDGKAYGGSSGEIEKRWKNRHWALRNDRHHCEYFQNAWNLYGEESFEFIILEVIEDPIGRIAAEQIWLDIHHAAGTCYNSAITAGPAGPLSEEHKQKIRVGMTGKQNGLGYRHTEDAKRRIAEASKSRVFSEESRRRMSEAQKGNQKARGCKRSKETRRKMSKASKGRKHTDEARRRMSAAQQGPRHPMWGKHHSEETKRKMSKTQKGRKHSVERRQQNAMTSARPYPAFIHRDTGEIIPAGVNLKQMCQERGLGYSNMNYVKNGKQFRHKGWMLLVETGET